MVFLTVFLSMTPLLASDCNDPRPEGGDTIFADFRSNGVGVYWDVNANYDAIMMTLQGPNEWFFSETFFDGQVPAFDFRTDGFMSCDGLYKYALIVIPYISDPIYEALLDARREQDLDTISQLLIRAGVPKQAIVQTGSFTLQDGGVLPKSQGTGDSDDPTDDQVILDDLIVDGSACIGMDCINGESFGFDTIRLKENNLRIRFMDTSNSASFPSNDWQITANDSTNGGQNKFSIDDIDSGRTPFTIEAGAPSHSLYVDDSGRLGLGTSTPVVEIHLATGDTPTLRLDQDGSSGWAPQKWDVAGNEANFFIRDVTNGSQLPFRIKPDAPTNSIFIDTTGEVGLGTQTPDKHLDIEANDSPALRFTNTGSGGGGWDVFVNSNTARFNIRDNSTDNVIVKVEDGSNADLLRVGIDGDNNSAADTVSIGKTGSDAVLDVRGSISVDGTVVHADFVFEPEYVLDSIEEHSDFMWENKHLPALPKAPSGKKGPVDLVQHQMGILEELEKAHIYIEQLHNTIKDLEKRLDKLEAENQ